MLKFAELAAQKLPDVSIQVYFSDWCLPGKDARNLSCRGPGTDSVLPYGRTRQHRTSFKKTMPSESAGRIPFTGCRTESATWWFWRRPLSGAESAAHLSECLDVPMDADGFFVAEHPVKAPVSTLREGIWIAGCARGPCSMADAVTQGQAAAGLMLSRLIPGKPIPLPACVSEVKPDLCSGCRICLGVCPYGAISFLNPHAVIQEALCRGCGTCAASCPSNAIDAKQFTDKELTEEILGLLMRPESEIISRKGMRRQMSWTTSISIR